MKVILAEKPSVAVEIAKVLGVNKRGEGYIYNDKYSITWAYGHLVSLETDKAYGYEKWSLDNLPIFPEKFKLRLGNDSGIKKQFKVIEKLFSDADEIINATDAGREGELIFRYIYEFCNDKKSKNIKRLWISDITAETIKKGFSNLQDGAEFDNLYLASKARSESDWLTGINFTQCISLASQKRQPLSIGRVQTPTLKLIVDRYISNLKHEKIPYYIPIINVEVNDEIISLRSKENYDDKAKAHSILSKLESDKVELNVKDEESDDSPPLLFDLTELQKKANTKYKLSAKKTLQVCQSLYEKHKALSYPRTDSQYLSSNQEKEIAPLFESLKASLNTAEVNEFVNEAILNIPGNRIFNNSKLTDHHAIIPTNLKVDISSLDKDEALIYNLVVERFFSSFMDRCKKEKRIFSTVVEEIVFANSSTRIKNKGWYKATEYFNEKENEDSTYLPNVKSGSIVKVKECEVDEQFTKPLAIFTEATLLNEMQKVGKAIDDKDLKDAIKSCGLGTPATRADVIENLVKKTYIEKAKGKLIPTEIGIQLIICLKGSKISSPEFTADYELKLDLISKGEFKYSQFMDDTKQYIESLLPELKKAGSHLSKFKTKKEEKENVTVGDCPKCGKGKVKVGKNVYYCEFYPKKECDFIFSNEVAGKKVPESQAKLIVANKETKLIKGMLNKEKKPFDAKLKLNEEHKVVFAYDKKMVKKSIKPKPKKQRAKRKGI